MPKIFVSYVRNNRRKVKQLVDALRAYDIDVWFDQTNLKPDDRWTDVIRREISGRDFFIVCFSVQFSSRTRGYVFEELTQASEQIRQRPHNQRWFIPVLLSPCNIPDMSIGAGQTLHSFQRVNLYKNWDTGIRSILDVVKPKQQLTEIGELSGAQQASRENTPHTTPLIEVRCTTCGYLNKLHYAPRYDEDLLMCQNQNAPPHRLGVVR